MGRAINSWALLFTMVLIIVGDGILWCLGFDMLMPMVYEIIGALALFAILWAAPDEHIDDHEALYPDYPDLGDTHMHLPESAVKATRAKLKPSYPPARDGGRT